MRRRLVLNNNAQFRKQLKRNSVKVLRESKDDRRGGVCSSNSKTSGKSVKQKLNQILFCTICLCFCGFVCFRVQNCRLKKINVGVVSLRLGERCFRQSLGLEEGFPEKFSSCQHFVSIRSKRQPTGFHNQKKCGFRDTAEHRFFGRGLLPKLLECWF